MPGLTTLTRTYTALTERERFILTMVAEGAELKDVAPQCGLAVGTIKNAMETIREKLGATTRIEAIALAITLGEIPCPYCKREHRFTHRSVKDHKRR